MRARWLILGTLALVGCQGAAPDATPNPTPPTSPVDATITPQTDGPTDIGIEYEGKTVNVGMSPEEALAVFSDPRKGGILDDQLPPGLKSPFRARSWETAGRGFGVITYNDKVVLAMYQEDRQNEETLEKVVSRHQALLGYQLEPKRIEENRVSYWFWEKDGQRLMVCGFKTDKGVDLTVAMGDVKVMDAVNASPEKAEATGKRIALETASATNGQTTPTP